MSVATKSIAWPWPWVCLKRPVKWPRKCRCTTTRSPATTTSGPRSPTASRLRRRGPLLFPALRDRNRFRLHPRHEILIRRRLNDRIELRSVVSDKADPLDDDVIDEPAVATPVHSIVDGNLRALLGDDLGAHGRQLALGRLAGVADLLAGVQLELGHVRALHEVGEQFDEFFLLGRRAPVPVPRQSTLCHRSEEHTSELQSLAYLVCRLLLEKKKTNSSILSSTN